MVAEGPNGGKCRVLGESSDDLEEDGSRGGGEK